MAHDAHASGATAAPHPHYKQYWIIFGFLAVLTAVEIAVVYLPIERWMIIAGLIFLAVLKAALVGLYFMHLIHETTILRLMIAIPLSLPPLYALVLRAEAAWRLFGGPDSPAAGMGK